MQYSGSEFGEWLKIGLGLSVESGSTLSFAGVDLDGMCAQWIGKERKVRCMTDAHRYHVVAHAATGGVRCSDDREATFRKPPKKQIPRGAHIHN